MSFGFPTLTLLAALAIASPALAEGDRAQNLPPSEEALTAAYAKSRGERRPYSPYAERDFPARPLFGDTHLHTSYSMDAGAFGARLDPNDAYRFARGEEVTSSTGLPVKLARPLDFLVVADHSDNMGFFPRLYAGDPELLKDETGKRWYEMVQAGGEQGVEVALEVIASFSENRFPPALASLPGDKAYADAWQATILAAEGANDPGRFTAFIGYEWTSNTKGNNLHRVVVYRDGGEKASQTEPYTTLAPAGSDDPKELWKNLAAYEQKTGGDVLAIAHNGNLSNGIMFPRVDSFSGEPIDRAYAEARSRWEPIYEATQIKGDGEAHPFLSPNDEFADFETWDVGNLTLSVLKADEMLQYEYARSALKLGLELEAKLGVNPYKFGMIGSTDSHTGLATADEDNFFGKHSGAEPSPERIAHPMAKFGEVQIMGWEMVASGYAAVWAQENTREAIFDAMERKETYATTGPRMVVRFFGGWDFAAADTVDRNPALVGYAKGVPMGGDLSNAPRGKAPTFLVAALRDPIGANLDRVQIVKGWRDAAGALHERVYDVALSGGRKVGPDGRCREPVGNTVDLANASYTNAIGASELISVWRDPDFDPKQAAVYYARVLEIPTPRWTAYEAKYYGLELADDIPKQLQDRAYTSPIWYTP
jgi:hypothetical protein